MLVFLRITVRLTGVGTQLVWARASAGLPCLIMTSRRAADSNTHLLFAGGRRPARAR